MNIVCPNCGQNILNKFIKHKFIFPNTYDLFIQCKKCKNSFVFTLNEKEYQQFKNGKLTIKSIIENEKIKTDDFILTLKNFIPEKVFIVLQKYLNEQPFIHKIIKLQEETGELSQAYLKYIKAKNSSANEKLSNDYKTLLEECIDVLLVNIDILHKIIDENNLHIDEIKQMFLDKINKFENKMKGVAKDNDI